MLSHQNSGRFLSKKYNDKRNECLVDKAGTSYRDLIKYDLQKDLPRFVNEENYKVEFEIPVGLEGDTKTIKFDIRDLKGHH